MKSIVVIAPHPDDETLGCGGTLLRHIDEGDTVHWLILTSMHAEYGFAEECIALRANEIREVAELYGFHAVHQLNFPTTRLETIPIGELISAIKNIFQETVPSIVYLPYPGDVHTDHQIAFNAAVSCAKWFRQASIKRILAYETLSETEFGINPMQQTFTPNVFVNITEFSNRKLEILHRYAGETGIFPFPRSTEAVAALAALRGANAGCAAAEAFMLLKEIL